MLLKQALFMGQVKSGQEAAMRAFVEAELAPLWRQFTGASRIEILFGHEEPDAEMPIPLVLSVLYESEAKLAEAMASPARYESRDMLPDFYERFWDQVRLIHKTYELAKER